MPPLAYKKNFKSTPALQLFYSGGPVRLAPDASFAACACGEEVKLVDINSGTLSKSIPGDSELVTSFVISPNGKSLFTASRSLQVKHWDLATVTVQRSWKAHDGPVPDMAVDASGGLLATASADNSVRVWDIDGGFCTHSFKGHEGVVTRVLFHPDPHRLLLFSGGDDATVRVWDLVTKKCLAVFRKHFSVITSLAVSTNGWSLLTGARDKVVNVWSLRDYSHEVTVPVYEAVEAVCVIPDGCDLPGSALPDQASKKKSRFLTVGEHGIIRVFSTEGAKCLYKQEKSDVSETIQNEDSRRGFSDAILLPGARGLLCVTVDHRLLFYEPFTTDNGQRDLRVNKRLIGYSDEITDLRYVGEHESMLAVASNVEQVRLYDIATLTCTHELTGHTDIVLCLDSCISPAGRPILASGAKDHTLRLWDVQSGSCIAMAAGHMAAVGAVAFSRKHRNFLISGSRDRTIKLWNLDSVLNEVPDVPSKLSSQAAVAAHDKDINSVAVAPNDSLVCSGSQDTTARVWKLPELTPVCTFRGHKRGVWSVEFSPVDQCVLTASGDKTIRVWALSDSSCLRTFEGHTASVLRASFISHGTQIISAGADGLLKLWTIRNNECINTFDQHTDKIWALTVSPKSEHLASGGGDSMVMLWSDCTVEDEEDAALKEAEEVLKDQDLSNALADSDYEKAIQLAFELRRPYKLLKVFTELFKAGGDSHVHSVLAKLDKEYLHLLLEYVREWNSKSKFCYVAQCVLQHLFVVFPPAELTKVPGATELLEGILPYSQRHFNRIDRLARSCFVLDYTLACMSVLMPVDTASVSSVKPVFDFNSFKPVGMKSYWDQQSGVNDVIGGDKQPNDSEEGLSSSGELLATEDDSMVAELEEENVAVKAEDNVTPSDKRRPKKKKRQTDGEADDASLQQANGGQAAQHEKKKRKKSAGEAAAQNGGDEVQEQQPQSNGTSKKKSKDSTREENAEKKKKTREVQATAEDDLVSASASSKRNATAADDDDQTPRNSHKSKRKRKLSQQEE